jgi:rRNA processing protein Gar1
MSTYWNPMEHADYDALKGYDVYSRDNEKVGTIKEVLHPATEMPSARGKHYFKVDPGTVKRIFGDLDEVYVPERLIQAVDPGEDKVILEVTKDRLKDERWSRPSDFDTFRRS